MNDTSTVTMSLKNILKRAQIWDAAFDELDNFRDLNHLIHIILERVKKILPDCEFHFFVHCEAKKEYREEIKDDIISIDEHNILLTYLSLKDELIYKKTLDQEKLFKENDITEFILFKKLGLKAILPFVHSFRLLGFLGISFNSKREKLSKDETRNLENLRKEALLNLNAALLVDRRFGELMILAELGKEISAQGDIKGLCNFIFKNIHEVVDFEGGVLYLTNVKGTHISPKAHEGINKKLLKKIKIGNSISGTVAKGGKPLLIKNLESNNHFNELNEELFLDGSIISLPLKTKHKAIGVLTLFSSKEHGQYTGENLHLISIIVNFASTAIENIYLYEDLEKSYFETVSALTGALDASDPYTKGHSERVMIYSEGVAKVLKMSKEEIKMIKFGALLHDIGKIGISGDIIRKPSRLTEQEYEIIKQHPKIGEQILSGVKFLTGARDIVKYHHEKLDGTGYPYKLTGDKIPTSVKILQVADVFDALSSDRPYRKAMTPQEAMEVILKDVGTHFDLDVVNAFFKYLKQKKMIDKDYKVAVKTN